jgi:TolA-binding protein
MKYLVSILFLFFISINCSKDPNDFSKMNEEELQKRSDELYASGEFQKSATCLETFIKKYPQNPNATKILNNLASIYGNEIKDMNKALEQYKKIITDYPQSNECPNAMFTTAFLYNEQKNYDQAKIYYEMFIQKFPNHEAVTSAKFELANLGKSMDEIMQKISLDSAKTGNK